MVLPGDLPLMVRIVSLEPDLSATAFELVIALVLAISLLLLRHLISNERVATFLGAGVTAEGPFRWPLSGSPRLVASHRLLAAALIGVPSTGTMIVLLGPRSIFELTLGGHQIGAALGIGALAGAVLASFMAVVSRQGSLSDRYPAMRPPHWTVRTALVNAGTWAIYLSTYEYLLRGVLLGIMSIVVGPLPALVVTVCVDALAHIPQGRLETLGSIFSATLFSLMAFATGGMIASFIAHLIMALSVDLFCARVASRSFVARTDG